jgi:16S rRNA (guanine527-N7)-methyltransferase
VTIVSREHVSRETSERLAKFVELLIEENARQNLVARSTLDDIEIRHIDDSLQLLRHAPAGRWLDIGTGAGLPGMVVAIARPHEQTILVEPRSLRAEFLRRVVDSLALPNVYVIAAKVETVGPLAANVISARAVASLDRLFSIGLPHAARDCVWLLSKGRNAAAELAAVRRTWQGRFDLIPSETDPEAAIVMAREVQPIRRKSYR